MKTILGISTATCLLAASLQATAATKATSSPLLERVSPAAAAPEKAAQVSDAEIRKLHLDALERAARGDTKSALATLEKAASVRSSSDEKDRVHLSMGRIAYELGQTSKAIDSYKKVSRGSPSWLESLEERAWAELRMGQPEQALATVKTVITPIFADQVRTEPYFLMALAQLRVCAYSAVFKTLENFKKRYRDKVRTWESSSDQVAKARLQEVSETIQKLNLVEAEAIQRLYIDENGKRHGGAVPQIARGSHDLSFPETEGEEVWLDEVESWRVRVKGCPAPNAQAPRVAKTTGKGNNQ
jgi:tetratricopeptide (TPR) repeat protein